MTADMPLLSIMIFMPIIGGLLTMWMTGRTDPVVARMLAVAIALVSLGLCIPLVHSFDYAYGGMQWLEVAEWIPTLGIQYTLGIDGISLALILLTCFTTLVVVLAAWQSIHEKINQYLAAFLIMHGMMIGVFAAMDAILFYVFWEGMLIPMYLAIGVWGSQNRSYSAIKFFLFTFFGSVLMLVAFLYLGFKADSFAIAEFVKTPLAMAPQIMIFIGFFMAFAVKVPMWPVHTWLPDAHTEAPTGGSVVLAAIMLKMGGYGFLRFSLPIVPDASNALSGMMIALSLIAVVYIGFVALVQTDMKRLIAYSSIAHMGFATLGCFIIFKLFALGGDTSAAALGLEGAIVQMISHAFSSGAMFLGVGVLYDRLHTRTIGDFGGVAAKMPIFATLFLLFAMANTGLPGTSGFVGEFMVILSAWQANVWVAIAAATTLILSAAYTLWMVKRVFFGEVVSQKVAELVDLTGLEISFFVLLAAALLFLGIYPAPLLDMLHASVQQLVELCQVSKL